METGNISHASNQNYMQMIIRWQVYKWEKKRFFTDHITLLWNWLPQNIVEATCINEFRKVIIQINERKASRTIKHDEVILQLRKSLKDILPEAERT